MSFAGLYIEFSVVQYHLQCSRGCAGGVRYREVFCAIPLDGTVVDDILCRELYPGGMPPAYDICFNKCKCECE